jgi:transcription elongation factor GreA
MEDEMNEISNNQICITEFDRDCLLALLARMSRSGIYGQDVKELEEILTCASIVDRRSESKIVDLYSTVHLKDLDFKREYFYQLVLPLHGNLNEGKVSILAPIGRGMLGRKAGDVFDVDAPAGFRTFRVEEIHQLAD